MALIELGTAGWISLCWLECVHSDGQKLEFGRLEALLPLGLDKTQAGFVEEASECAIIPAIPVLSATSSSSCWQQRKTDLVTELSTSSNSSSPVVLLFSLTTIKPPSGFSAALHRCRNATSCSSVRCTTHHWIQMRSYCTPAAACQSSSPMLKMLRTPGLPCSAAVNLAMGSMTSTSRAMPSRRRPSVTRPMLWDSQSVGSSKIQGILKSKESLTQPRPPVRARPRAGPPGTRHPAWRGSCASPGGRPC